MTNPFDDDNAPFYVLINDEGEHSLWPTFATVPGGWTIAHGPSPRTTCLDYVETHWLDMRPASLIRAMSAEAN
ncbi:MbtH family protein [Nocardia cyriacigeorgica]|uniref:MbtH family protein n=1 Tax=Nocardia cyriacigeorgica TaxID=135487 RepID=UPI002456309C|nr:MbtH family protein [Nocardia cyriacigeorgica]